MAPRTRGEALLAEVGQLLADQLPGVAFDDPFRPGLLALAYAAGRPDAERHLALADNAAEGC